MLIYTSLIMLILRFFAGPIVHKLSPLGLLAVSAAIAACGLVFLSKSTGHDDPAAATLYGFGKTFFWPTMLGVVAEQFPKGGALTLEHDAAASGCSPSASSGRPLLGNIQDKETANAPEERRTPPSTRGRRRDEDERLRDVSAARPEEGRRTARGREGRRSRRSKNLAKKDALMTVAIFPCIMLVCYLGLIVYFKSQGGYKPKILISQEEEAKLMTGGATGPDEF